jgi:hypothetical protein
LQDAVALAGQAPFMQAGTGVVARTIESKLRDVVSIEDFGAVGDGVTDCTAAIQAGLNYLNTMGGGTLWIPDGRFRKLDTAGSQLVMYSNITIKGNGDSSVIFFDDRVSEPRSGNDFLVANNVENICFDSFKIEGTVLTHLSSTNQKQCLTGSYITNLSIRNVTIEKVRYMATAFGRVKNASITGCKFRYVLRDGARCTNSQNVSITNNLFQFVSDDAIAIHSLDEEPVPGSDVVVVGNILEGCQGIKALGGKSVVIAHNIIRRSIRNPIQIGLPSAGPEGRSQIFAINVSHNIITDTFGTLGTNSCIRIYQSQGRNNPDGSSYPGLSSTPYAYNYLNSLDQTKVILAQSSIKISDNIISRTLPDGVQYSDWGYGQMFDRITPGLFSDPSISSSSFQTHGIQVSGASDNVQIVNNQINGMGLGMTAVLFEVGTTSNQVDFRNVLVSGNLISDCPGIGVGCPSLGSGPGAKQIIVTGNLFDLDPYFRSPSHNADNTWSTLSVSAITLPGIHGIVVNGNTFKNCAQTGISLLRPEASANVVYADFVGISDHTGNKGVRELPSAATNMIMPIDGDPTSSTYGQILNSVFSRSPSIPESGRYLRGHRVWSDSPAPVGTAGSRYLVLGWMRLTTGDSHVLNTDWAEIRTPVGT